VESVKSCSQQSRIRSHFEFLVSRLTALAYLIHSVERIGARLNRLWLVLLATISLGLCSFGVQFSAARPGPLMEAAGDFNKVRASFTVLDEPRIFGSSQNFRTNIKITTFELGKDNLSLNARGELRGGKEIANLLPKANYSCLLQLRPAKDADRAGYLSNCKGAISELSQPPETNFVIHKIREAFLESSQGITQDARGLVAGLAIGDTSMLSEELLQAMKSVSLTHLTAVSGANCAIVLGLVYFLTIKLGGGRRVRLVAGLFTLLTYVALVGAQPSVLRAAVMAGAVLVTVSLGRKTQAMNALGFAIIILLVADPWLAVDFGFALSVAATAGLLVLTEPLVRKLSTRMPRWLAISVAVAVSAQIFCFPILLQLQAGLSTYALPANLLAEPLVAPITVLGILALVCAVPLPWLATLLSYTASLGTNLIATVATFFSGLPNTTLSWPQGIPGLLAALLMVLGFSLWLRSKKGRLQNLGIIILSMVLALSVGTITFFQFRAASWPMKDWQVVACDVGQGDAMVLRSQSLIAVIDVGRDDDPVDDCLSQLGVRQIDLLVLTHFDMDHVGGIQGALKNRKVSTVLISPFKDERWGATGTNFYLQKTRAKVILAEQGVNGKLGDFAWQVLSPNHDAQGAEDSNDASIVMLWSTNYLNLLTMADIGERGQMRMVSKSNWWKSSSLGELPMVLKVSHHGSADQYPELIEQLDPEVSLISVGTKNSYGHPTSRTLSALKETGSQVLRTDQLGSIALYASESGLIIANSPRLTG